VFSIWDLAGVETEGRLCVSRPEAWASARRTHIRTRVNKIRGPGATELGRATCCRSIPNVFFGVVG